MRHLFIIGAFQKYEYSDTSVNKKTLRQIQSFIRKHFDKIRKFKVDKITQIAYYENDKSLFLTVEGEVANILEKEDRVVPCLVEVELFHDLTGRISFIHPETGEIIQKIII